jgi:hypothetical protein
MPPEVKMIPLPRGRGQDAYAYLAAHGLIPKVPNIRSSDSGTSPFQYYLSRRLGLRPAYSYYEPFSIGDWAHAYLQLYYTENRDERYQAKVREYCARLKDLAAQPEMRWTSDKLNSTIAKIKDDALYARALFLTGIDINMDGKGTTIRNSVLDSPRLRPLASELVLRVPYHKTELVAQLDLLMYDEEAKLLRLPDLKTTSAAPKARADQCPVDYQTWLYLYVTNEMLPHLIEKYDLAPETRVASMDHLIIRKPNIRMSREDVPKKEYEHVLKSGPNKGQTVIRWEPLSDEPEPELFRERMVDYMRGTGQYDKYAMERADEPWAEVSFTHFEGLHEWDWKEFWSITNSIYDLATREPHPENFPRHSKSMVDRGDLTPYAYFYRLPVQAWPKLVRDMNMIVDFRDPDTQETTNE